jgi:predicted O-methyltransferase YrrM
MNSPSRWDPNTAPPGSADEERTSGSRNYLDSLAELHATLDPAFYLEIGVRHGYSLTLASCPAIGVDPAPEIKAYSLPSTTRLSVMTSDDFFAGLAAEPLPWPPDFAFIDGMHLFEYALRDFMNIERLAKPTTLIAIDDIFPSHPAQGARERRTRVWTGDVWKLHRCLAELRPDLVLLALDAAPAGLLLVAGLDPGNRVLWDRHDQIVREYCSDQSPPPPVLQRTGAIAPTHPAVNRALSVLRQCRIDRAPRQEVADRLRSAIAAASTR